MAFLFVFLVGLLSLSDAYIWENTAVVRTPKENLQIIPPLAQTAETLSNNFLKHGNKRPVAWRHERFGKSIYEVVLLIDSSGSVEYSDFQKGLQGMQQLMDRMKPETTVAAVTFSTNASTQFPFVPIAEATRRVGKIRHRGKKTNTLDALKHARTLFINKTMERVPGKLRVARHRQIFMVTDGKPNAAGNTKSNLLSEARRLKYMGVEIFILVIGKKVDGIWDIANIASSVNRHFYRVEKSSDFIKVVNLIQIYSGQK